MGCHLAVCHCSQKQRPHAPLLWDRPFCNISNAATAKPTPGRLSHHSSATKEEPIRSLLKASMMSVKGQGPGSLTGAALHHTKSTCCGTSGLRRVLRCCKPLNTDAARSGDGIKEASIAPRGINSPCRAHRRRENQLLKDRGDREVSLHFQCVND